MNVLAAIRGLMENTAEGRRMELLGPDFRQKRERQQLEMERIRQAMAGEQDDRARTSRDDINKFAAMMLAQGATQDRGPDIPVSDAAGGVGPPAPGAEPSAEFIAPDNTRHRVEGVSRTTALERMVEEMRAKGALETEQKVGEAEALTPAAVDRQRQLNTLPLSAAEREREANDLKRAGIMAAGRGGGGTGTRDEAFITDLADRYASGELTSNDVRGYLGGVQAMRGPVGQQFWQAVGDRRGVSPQIRKDLVGVTTTRNIVGQMEALVEQIIAAKTPEARAQATLLLEQFGQTTGTLLARGFGERGVVTDKDVSRATGLVPGWKAANFAPEYARREIALLNHTLDLNEQGIMGGNTQQRTRSGEKIDAKPNLRFNPATGEIE